MSGRFAFLLTNPRAARPVVYGTGSHAYVACMMIAALLPPHAEGFAAVTLSWLSIGAFCGLGADVPWCGDCTDDYRRWNRLNVVGNWRLPAAAAGVLVAFCILRHPDHAPNWGLRSDTWGKRTRWNHRGHG